MCRPSQIELIPGFRVRTRRRVDDRACDPMMRLRQTGVQMRHATMLSSPTNYHPIASHSHTQAPAHLAILPHLPRCTQSLLSRTHTHTPTHHVYLAHLPRFTQSLFSHTHTHPPTIPFVILPHLPRFTQSTSIAHAPTHPPCHSSPPPTIHTCIQQPTHTVFVTPPTHSTMHPPMLLWSMCPHGPNTQQPSSFIITNSHVLQSLQ